MGTPNLSPQGKKMLDLNTGFIQKPDDGLGYSRAFCAAIGRLEDLDRTARIRVWYAGAYRVGTVGVKIPGNCYWVKLDVPLGQVSKLVVNCANFGGRVHD